MKSTDEKRTAEEQPAQPIPEKADEQERQRMERMGIFMQNRQAFPLDELAKYAGQWIAWSPDGSRIVASSRQSSEAVDDLVIAAGLDPSKCVISYVPGDETSLGW